MRTVALSGLRAGMSVGLAVGMLIPASLLCAQGAPTPPPTPAMSPAGKEKLPPPLSAQAVRARVTAAIDALQTGGDWNAARGAVRAEFDRLLAYGDLKQGEAFAEAARWTMLLSYLDLVPDAEARRRLLIALRAQPELADAMAFVTNAEFEKPGASLTLLDRLVRERPEQVAKFPQLAAAVALVHDEPLTWSHGSEPPEKRPAAKAPDALEIFDYFAGRERQLLNRLRDMPAEVLIYVVDTTEPVAELEWIERRHGGRNIAPLYAWVTYDHDALRRGMQFLKINQVGVSLENIAKAGGVCAHQAYFSAHAGKAQGIPTVQMGARGPTMGHAWLGFLDISGRNATWNFDAGRYESYRVLRGTITDPATRRSLSEGHLRLMAEYLRLRVEKRRAAAALTHGARRLFKISQRADGAEVAQWPPAWDLAGPAPRAARAADTAVQLEILREAVNQGPGYARAWDTVSAMAQQGTLAPEAVRPWAEALVKMLGRDNPDFSMEILRGMFTAATDPVQQDKLWDWAFGYFFRQASDQSRRSVTVASEILFRRAQLWEKAGNVDRAGEFYKRIISEFADDAPDAVTAAEAIRRAYAAQGRQADAAEMISTAWRRMAMPAGDTDPGILGGSNWFQLGMVAVRALEDAGEGQKASSIRRQLTNFQARGS
ncbi:MAG: hypothetical protein SFY95_06445 [Planctomycetota bacterium]|nr:hypothetical protein [Planctomycetota bacterium]